MKIALAALLASASPALGQSMDHSMHHPVPQPEAAPAHDHAMAGMDMPTPAAEPQGAGLAGTDQPPGNAAPPRIANDRAGDLYWSPAAMAAAEATQNHYYYGARIMLERGNEGQILASLTV